MGKNKLKKFAELETFVNVFQCPANALLSGQNEYKGSWHRRFGNDNAIVLELGCGRGEYTVGLARLHPEKNYIGVDIKGARLWAGAKEAFLAKMTNVFFLRTDIEMLPALFAPDEVSEIWLTFPDPQMKKTNKRLTSTAFMRRYEQFMQNNAPIHLKTDSPFLYAYTRAMLQENNYEITADSADVYADKALQDDREVSGMQTHYEKQWLERGMKIKYLKWLLKKKEHLVEPAIEIEKDDYKSYKRK